MHWCAVIPVDCACYNRVSGSRYDHALTTLGRGGSDTTAVAVAAALNADECQIFIDEQGIYAGT